MVKKPMSGYCASFPVFGGSVYVYVSGQESGEGGGGGAHVRGERLKNSYTRYSCLYMYTCRLNFILLLWLPMATLTRTRCAG